METPTLPGSEYGPWEALSDVVRTHFVHGDPNRPGFLVADLSGSPLGRKPDMARLIAAAPALLVALGALVDAIDFEGAEGRIWFNPGSAWEADTLRAARAALALTQVREG